MPKLNDKLNVVNSLDAFKRPSLLISETIYSIYSLDSLRPRHSYRKDSVSMCVSGLGFPVCLSVGWSLAAPVWMALWLHSNQGYLVMFIFALEGSLFSQEMVTVCQITVSVVDIVKIESESIDLQAFTTSPSIT